MPLFNYIITIHNKEDLIHDVLMAALLCCGPGSNIYAVLDGCTDRTEAIIDDLTGYFQGAPIVKVYAPDVHELKSINAGLRAAPQDGDRYNIILQDDVILGDLSLETKVAALYDWGGPSLGYISLRLGANFTSDASSSADPIPLTDYIENAYGHGLPEAELLLPGRFAYRTVPIKSPVCLPSRIVRELGSLNEDLAPYAHDDTDYAIRATNAGYRNGVFGLRFYSDVKWGTTRISPTSGVHKMQVRNMDIIRQQLSRELQAIEMNPQSKEIVQFPHLTSPDLDAGAVQQSKRTKEALSAGAGSIAVRARGRLRRLFADFTQP